MKTMIRVGFAALVAMSAMAMVTAAATDDCPATGEFYSVEHALCEENIGSVTLDAAGRFLTIRRLEPARRAKTFPWSLDAHFLSLHRSSLSILDLDAGAAAAPRTVVRHDQALPYAMSPDGERLLFLKARARCRG